MSDRLTDDEIRAMLRTSRERPSCGSYEPPRVNWEHLENALDELLELRRVGPEIVTQLCGERDVLRARVAELEALRVCAEARPGHRRDSGVSDE